MECLEHAFRSIRPNAISSFCIWTYPAQTILHNVADVIVPRHTNVLVVPENTDFDGHGVTLECEIGFVSLAPLVIVGEFDKSDT